MSMPEVDRWLHELVEALPPGHEMLSRLLHLQQLIARERLAHADMLAPPPPPVEKRPALREQRFQLSADARLQFWREAYLNAQSELIRTRPYLGDAAAAADVAERASDLADMALAQHLLRNDVEWPDSCVDLWMNLRRSRGV